MNNNLIEFSVSPTNERKEKTIYLILKVLQIFSLFSITAMLFLTVLNILLFPYLLLTIAFFIMITLLMHQFYTFFDYMFVDGDIYCTKVINNKKRVKYIGFKAKDITEIGFSNTTRFLSLENDKSLKKYYGMSKFSDFEGVYFLVKNTSGEILFKSVYNENFLYSIIKRTGTQILTTDFKEKF